MTKVQTSLFALIFGSFALACAILTLAIYWAAGGTPAEQVTAQRDMAVMLGQIAGETIEPQSEQSGQLVAVAASALPTAQVENGLPLPTGSYRSAFNLDFDAFSFRNYGSTFPAGNLSVVEAREIFGDGVCVRLEGDACVPTPSAQFWIDQMNDAMNQGHCLGFTVLAYDLFSGNLSQQQFQNDAAVTHALGQEPALMRTIAQRWSLQTTPELLNASVTGTPRDIIVKLFALREPVDLGLFGRKGGGHSVLAYGVDQVGESLYHILVYDNNWPDKEPFVEVDTANNTWRYTLSGENPGEAPTVWEGDADSRTLIFVPLSAYRQPVTCPFCPASTGAFAKPGLAMLQQNAPATNFVIVALKGEEGRLQVTSAQGDRIGHFGDTFVNEVPGALSIRPRSALYNDGEPILFLPVDQEFTVQVLPRDGVQAGSTSLRVIGPDMAVALDNLALTPGAADQLRVSPVDRQIGYQPGGNQSSPTLQFAYTQNGTSYLAVLSTTELLANQELTLGVTPAHGELTIASSGGSDQTVTLLLSKINATGSSQFASNRLALSGQGVVALAVQNWQDDAPLALSVDENGDGTVERTENLADQPVGALFGAQPTAKQLGNSLGETAPYLQPKEASGLQQTLLDAIENGSLSGSEAGQLLFELELLGMDIQQVAAFIQATQLPIDQRAALLYNLHLGAEEQSEIRATIAQSAAELSGLGEALAQWAEAAQVVNEFEFSGQEPETFANFVAGQDIVPEVKILLPTLQNLRIDELGAPTQSASEIATAQATAVDEPGSVQPAAAVTSLPPTNTPLPPTPTPTATSLPPTNTPLPPTPTSTATSLPPTNTPLPPTPTSTATSLPPTNTPLPPTPTPTVTSLPPTNTPLPPTPTRTATSLPPTNTPLAAYADAHSHLPAANQYIAAADAHAHSHLPTANPHTAAADSNACTTDQYAGAAHGHTCASDRHTCAAHSHTQTSDPYACTAYSHICAAHSHTCTSDQYTCTAYGYT
jgi:hypothetical protein